MSLRPFFEPRTVAVIGAGRRRGTVGGEIFHNLASGGFRVLKVGALLDACPTIAECIHRNRTGPLHDHRIEVELACALRCRHACPPRSVERRGR